MRSCAALFLVLLLAASAFAEETPSADRLATAAEMSAIEARIDALHADLTRDLEARIERRLTAASRGGPLAPWVAATYPAAPAPRADVRSESEMPCAFASDGKLVCTVVAVSGDLIAEADTRR